MPKASIEKDSYSRAAKDDVRPTPREYGIVNPEAEAPAMELGSQS
jgi:hypothetical protein